jgi:general secretion pathway protein F
LAQFQYRAVDAQGKLVEGTIDAAEVPVVVARLHDRGLIPINIGEVTAGSRPKARRVSLPTLPTFGGKRVKRRDLLVMTQELTALVSAGLPLDRSLATLADLTEHGELKRAITEVLHAVQGGKSLAEALAAQKIFPPIYVNMVRAGEAGGFLESALQRLEEYLDRSQQLRDDVSSALAYPVLLVVILGGSLVFLLIYVLPRFEVLFADLGKAVPLPAQIVITLSGVLRSYWWVLLGVIGIAVGAFRYSVSTPRGRYGWDQWKLRIPIVGTLLRKMEVATLARTLGTLLKSGVPLLSSLSMVREIVRNQVISRALGEVEVGAREGAGIAAPLAHSGVFPQLAVQMIGVGEETGRLDELLLKVADHFDREVRTAIQQLMRLLEPALIVFMGLAVGSIVVSMLSAIFSINELPF